MKLLISRGRFQRLTVGLSPVAVAELAEMVELYPDDLDVDWHVDQGRIGERYEQLLREPPPSPWRDREPVERWWSAEPAAKPWIYRELWEQCAEPGPQKWHYEPPADQEAGPELAPPWRELGPGVWWAPEGTPPPTFERHVPQQTHPDDMWLGVNDLVDDLVVKQDHPDRYFLNDWTPSEPAKLTVEVLTAYTRQLMEADLPGPRRLEAGWRAVIALALAARPRRRGWAKDVVSATADLVALAGIPIVRNPNLPGDQWRLLDAKTEDVLHEGTISPSLADHLRVVEDCVDRMADEFDVPRDLLRPPYGDT